MSSLILPIDPHWRSPPLCNNFATDHSEKARTSRHTRTAVSTSGYQPPLQFIRHLYCGLRFSKAIPCVSVQRRDLSERPGESRQTGRQSNDRPRSHGGHDGYDEGEHGDDDPPNTDHGLDQCFLCWLCYQYVQSCLCSLSWQYHLDADMDFTNQ